MRVHPLPRDGLLLDGASEQQNRLHKDDGAGPHGGRRRLREDRWSSRVRLACRGLRPREEAANVGLKGDRALVEELAGSAPSRQHVEAAATAAVSEVGVVPKA
ncbi:hypothetical protein P43SY_011727 [Pythium insidiosum]|uniref:Uncharacterized protein n=1 Tax=Pythium insidiosum TaxID=114742 RepID=A0AAD5LR14_PYTIN|nr:hypothetical protein P43SY_011727 [Pythium insidiosum]